MAGYFTTFGDNFHAMVGTFAKDASGALITTLGPIVASGLIIYLMVYGWLIGSGRVQGSMGQSVMLAVKIAFIAFFGLNIGTFTNYVIPAVDQFENVLLSVASSGFSGPVSLNQNLTSSWEAIDRLWLTFTDGWQAISDASSKLNWLTSAATIIALMGCEIVMGIISVLFTFSACGVLLINETTLAVILGFGPLFICSLMFPPIKSWFDGWLKAVVTFAFTLVMSATVTSLFSSVFTSCLEKITTAAEAENVQIVAIGLPLMNFCVLALIGATFIKQVPTITAALTGGMNMGAVGLGQMLHGAGQTARSVAGGLTYGAGAAMGSQAVKNFGSSMLGSQGLGGAGALGMAGLGAAAGFAARIGKDVINNDLVTPLKNQAYRGSSDFNTPQRGSVSAEFAGQQATAQQNAATAAKMVANRRNKGNKNV
ncbi:type IV secretion system protein [Turicimonas muris]|uniref:type IV secretion system protein n=3 Tax=Turicimonas muris TaxID=1796652 RepID=UPI002596EE55|nr:type IV secretion system protein [uncultured Parasutterella sp.]